MSALDLTLDDKTKIRQQNAERQRRCRAKLTEEQRAFNKQRDAVRHRLKRANMNEYDKSALLSQMNAERHKKLQDVLNGSMEISKNRTSGSLFSLVPIMSGEALNYVDKETIEDYNEPENLTITQENDIEEGTEEILQEAENDNQLATYNAAAAELCVTEVTEYEGKRIEFPDDESSLNDDKRNLITEISDDSAKEDEPLETIDTDSPIKTEVPDEVEIKKEEPYETFEEALVKCEPSSPAENIGDDNNDGANFNENVDDIENNDLENDKKIFPETLPLSVQLTETDNMKYLSCKLCNYKTIKATALKRHMWIHTGRKIYSCNLCDYKTIESSTYKRHMMTHTGEKPYACSFCDYKTTQSCNFKRHMMTHNKTSPTYSCTICDFKTTRSTLLTKHMVIHDNQKPYGCNLCNYKTSQRSRVKRHMLIHTGEKSFSCNLCEYKTAQFSNFKRHMLIHTREKSYSCDICNYKTSQSSNVKRHKLTHHKDDKLNICNICQYKTIQLAAFKAHMITHTKEKTYECNFCKYITINSNSLKVHMMMHTGERPYVCNFCDYKTSQISNIKRHMIIHNENKVEHICEQCNYKTTQLTDLKLHIMTHTNEQQQNESEFILS